MLTCDIMRPEQFEISIYRKLPGSGPLDNLSMGIESHECDGKDSLIWTFFCHPPLFPNLVVIEGKKFV